MECVLCDTTTKEPPKTVAIVEKLYRSRCIVCTHFSLTDEQRRTIENDDSNRQGSSEDY